MKLSKSPNVFSSLINLVSESTTGIFSNGLFWSNDLPIIKGSQHADVPKFQTSSFLYPNSFMPFITKSSLMISGEPHPVKMQSIAFLHITSDVFGLTLKINFGSGTFNSVNTSRKISVNSFCTVFPSASIPPSRIYCPVSPIKARLLAFISLPKVKHICRINSLPLSRVMMPLARSCA